MKFTRILSKPGIPVADQVKWKRTSSKITTANGEVIFEMNDIEVPESWSQNATNIIAQKYFRKAGVPSDPGTLESINDKNMPVWLWQSYAMTGSTFGYETSAKQVFHRLCGAWTYWGWKEGIFTQKFHDMEDSWTQQDEESAKIFYDELYLILALQIAAPNSPQWFNTGLHWAYGITGDDNGQWATDLDGVPFETHSSYEYPQPHACFIQPISDDLVNPGGIMDLWVREARLFKQGSGTGTNFSNLRGKNELLSGGGKSSGLMSFLKIGDVTAGSIASGGTTRRAAKMICLDLDHPEIEDFVEWKMKEEAKAAALYIGSEILNHKYLDMIHDNHDKIYDLIPQAMLDRISTGIRSEICGLEFEGPAMNTVTAQNANNSPRVTNKFFEALDNDGDWQLTNRTDGKVYKTIKAKDLWYKICRAAWACGDPGLQFHDHINDMHTCKVDGTINASNPCSEYMFLDDTACNLASLNLITFLNIDQSFNISLFKHVTRLMTTVLEISVFMASFPSREIARNSYLYRTLGLGYANLGGILMQKALPYDSDEGRNFAANITALLHAQAYHTSNELAKELGSFERFEANRVSILTVLDKHISSCHKLSQNEILKATSKCWTEINFSYGFRNAQVTLIAPTGTISLLMDCDTGAAEPDFSLVKYKALSGGGNMKIVNESIAPALKLLGYTQPQIFMLIDHIYKTDTIEGCTVNGRELLPEEHLRIFDCAVAPPNGKRYLSPESHILMMAAIQPHLSGAISKTVNMPNSSTIQDVDKIFHMANEHKLKAVAIYRDGSKLTQPLNTKKEFQIEKLLKDAKPEDFQTFTIKPNEFIEFKSNGHAPQVQVANPPRRRLPSKASGYTQKVKIDGQSFYLHTSEYEDGSLGAVFLESSREGSTTRALMNAVGIAVSIGLQFGVPLSKFVEAFVYRKFEPAGPVQGHDFIKMCHSSLDFVFRDLAIHYLHQTEYANTVPNENDKHDRDNATNLIEEVMHLAKEIPTPVEYTIQAHLTSSYTGQECPRCHHATLRQIGNCVKCSTCDYDTGCG